MKKVLKSVVAVVLCLAMVLSLAACGPKYTNGISTEEFTDKKTGVSYKGRIKIGAAIARTGAYSLVGVDLCQYFGQKKLKYYADFFSSSSSLCCGVI